jgi:uncharacterized protein YdeI (YjbR/CyaY-like superfamily)
MNPKFFAKPSEFRTWLKKNHNKETEVIVGFYKVGIGKPSITWSEAVDQALCFGWIDGVRRSIDKDSYCNRFTPRRPGSNWSAINIKKVEDLTKKGLMQPPGLKAFEDRLKNKNNVYSFEVENLTLKRTYATEFRKHKEAWKFFKEQAPWYQKFIIHWIMTAKQEKTQLNRLDKAIKASAEGKRL